ncbi:MAG TPA: MASE1 domain-containing protein [Methylomirabilota bacterium]|nr:MASE1 domain-containing protein [Methylomirabilota bacterium]
MQVSGSRQWEWVSLAALTIVYVACGKLGLLFASVHASATAVWPPTGIALAALLLLGRRAWPAVAVGAFVVNVTTAGSVATSLGIALGNTLEGLLGAWLVERWAGGLRAFDRPRDVFAFATAALPAAAVSASIGVGSLALAGYAALDDLGAIWVTWALGDVAGALLVAPPIILWMATEGEPARPGRGRLLELGALLLVAVALAAVIWGGLTPAMLRQYPLAFVAIPPLLWAAYRFGRREAASLLVVLAAIAVYGTRRGFGPFAPLPPRHALLVLQAFMATMALMTLIVAVLAWSREREISLLQTIIDRIPVMITMYQPDARVLRLNHEFERVTGWSAEEARRVDLMERCYPDPIYRARVRAYMDSLAEGWRDLVMTTRGGERIETSWSNVRLPDDTRVGIGLDARERKRAEAERERAHAQAEAASRAKDEFFAMLGHELRNPLGAITTALHVIELCGPLDERSGEARAIIGRQVQHLVRLVDDLLDVTRLATGKISLSLRRIDLAAVARRAVAGAAPAARGRSLTCRAAESVWIDADETRIEQVLGNLLGNALKFTPADGRVTVVVEVEGSEAVLRVEDTGAGIPPDLLPRIFDLFVQGQTTLHRREAGLGIGLTLVRRLVDLHRGRIEAASAGPGRGSAFTVRLPAARPPGAQAARPAETPPPVARRRVLIIEDNDDARRMLRHLLHRAGHEVHEAAEGTDGLARALALAPDAVIVDIGLPGLDGYAIARRLRETGPPGVLLVAITGYGQDGDRQRSREAGFDVHLTKPIDPLVLDALLAQAGA